MKYYIINSNLELYNYIPIRIDDVTHNIEDGNWITTLSVKEDELSSSYST